MARLQLRQILFPVPEGVQDHFDGAELNDMEEDKRWTNSDFLAP